MRNEYVNFIPKAIKSGGNRNVYESEKQKHDKLVQLVDQMLENQEYYHNAKSEDDKKLYKRIIDQLDSQIDVLVYNLYDLTEEEIKVVEAEK